MEKYSAFRDPGTGIQPFLLPVPPVSSDALSKASLPIGYALAIVRTALVIAIGLLYAMIVVPLHVVLMPIPAARNLIIWLITAVLSRLALFFVGIWWVSVEQIPRKKGRGAKVSESWSPSAGDLIVSNWVSWVDVLYLAFRFNPIFVLPEPASIPKEAALTSAPVTSTPGRRTGTGSAAISSPATRSSSAKVPIKGFRRASLWTMLRASGHAPPFPGAGSVLSLNQILENADRPVVVFPECTTSNGRGILRFADILPGVPVPVSAFKVFVMCFRYDPPTAFAPTLSHPIITVLNPLSHVFMVSRSLAPLPMIVRLLPPSEGPSAPTFLSSDVLPVGGTTAPSMSDACSVLIAQVGKVKRVAAGWEDKLAFLEFYGSKRK